MRQSQNRAKKEGETLELSKLVFNNVLVMSNAATGVVWTFDYLINM